MNPYSCISTDNKVGLIEVVLNAETIANIQKEKGIFSATSAFRKGSLLGNEEIDPSLDVYILVICISNLSFCIFSVVERAQHYRASIK